MRANLYLEGHSIRQGVVTTYGGGGVTQREGGASEVLPLQKKRGWGGGRESFSHPKGGGHNKCWGSFNTAASSFNHTGGCHKRFPPLKGGAYTFSVYHKYDSIKLYSLMHLIQIT